MACAYKKINDINDTDCLETDLQFLGLIGIRDNLQEGVYDTVKELAALRVHCSMCTGDRRITAMAVGKEAGLYDNDDDLVDLDNYTDFNVHTKTLLFNGHTVRKMLTECPLSTKIRLQTCRNFIAYNLIPDDKRLLVETLDKTIMACGDGFNDISMFKKADVSVAIKSGNSYIEGNADVVVDQFSRIGTLIKEIGPNYHLKNGLLANYTFYRCVMIVISLMTFNLMSLGGETTALFDGFVIQAFNFAWCVLPIIWYCITVDTNGYSDNCYQDAKHMKSATNTNMWCLEGAAIGFLVTLLVGLVGNNVIGLLLILVLNAKLWSVVKDHNVAKWLLGVGPVLYLVYLCI
jgi:magnesium-transporting ATPase (P-type)